MGAVLVVAVGTMSGIAAAELGSTTGA